MKRKLNFHLTISLFLILGKLTSQTDTLNRFNSEGKKTGYWKVILNKNIDPIDSINNAYFYGIEQWDNGWRVFKYRKHDWEFSKLKYDKNFPEKGNPELIDGKFEWYDNNNNILCIEIYKKGQPLYFKSYNWNKSKTSYWTETLYFDRLYENIPGTFYMEKSQNGRIYKYWYRKKKKGWRTYKLKEQSFKLTKEKSEFQRIQLRASSNCFGNCPYYLLIIDSIGSLTLEAYATLRGSELKPDPNRNGNYIGKLTKKQLKKIIRLSSECAYDEHDNSGPGCCDGQWKYLIIKFKDKEKVIATMFPKKNVENLVNYLFKIIENKKLEKVAKK